MKKFVFILKIFLLAFALALFASLSLVVFIYAKPLPGIPPMVDPGCGVLGIPNLCRLDQDSQITFIQLITDHRTIDIVNWNLFIASFIGFFIIFYTEIYLLIHLIKPFHKNNLTKTVIIKALVVALMIAIPYAMRIALAALGFGFLYGYLS